MAKGILRYSGTKLKYQTGAEMEEIMAVRLDKFMNFLKLTDEDDYD